jgi:multidrug resistance protein, MATE family
VSGQGSFRGNVRHLTQLAWPVLIGQLSMLAFSTVDTFLVARASSADLAALAVGSAVYITVFIGLMGVVMALAPIVGQLYGAGKLVEAGRQVHQALWLALAFALLGSTLLMFPSPFVALSGISGEVEHKLRGYLMVLALSLPGSLLFTVFRGFNNAVSRPKVAMVVQVAGLALKVPLSTLLVFGWPAAGVPALGVVGCAWATCIVMWAQVLIAAWTLLRDPFYKRFDLLGRGLDRPNRAILVQHLRLGLPMGGAIMLEVTAFAFMAIFIARLGTTAVAAHQLVANLVSLLFMVPLSLANATSTLVAQRIGAGQGHAAQRLGWHGLGLGCLMALLLSSLVFVLREPVLNLYTRDPLVVAAALPLVTWLVLFHLGDATQMITAAILRANKVATLPMLVYVVAQWGVGIGGGYALAFNHSGLVPDSLRGASGFWTASTAAMLLASVALALLMHHTLRRVARQSAPPTQVAVAPAA